MRLTHTTWLFDADPLDPHHLPVEKVSAANRRRRVLPREVAVRRYPSGRVTVTATGPTVLRDDSLGRWGSVLWQLHEPNVPAWIRDLAEACGA